jgi:[acyl-carrier-protein] S-malonyltransferase
VRIGLMFAGQGAQEVGMGKELYDAFPVVRQTFHEAEEASGLPLRRLCFDGPEEELTRTEVAQPAILTVDIAAWRALGAPQSWVVGAAGLSLGEYAALVAAGSLELGTAVRLVRTRGRLMQEAVPEGEGGMLAVLGLEEAQVEEACRQAGGPGEVEPANYNAPGQVVVSGRLPALDRLAAILRSMGARRLVPLRVSAPFHMSLLAPAAKALARELEGVTFSPPAFPVWSNVTAQPHQVSDLPRLLAEQVDHPVRWEACVRALVERGAQELWEVGPGSALRGFARRIAPGLTVRGVATPSDVQEIEAAYGGLLR